MTYTVPKNLSILTHRLLSVLFRSAMPSRSYAPLNKRKIERSEGHGEKIDEDDGDDGYAMLMIKMVVKIVKAMIKLMMMIVIINTSVIVQMMRIIMIDDGDVYS